MVQQILEMASNQWAAGRVITIHVIGWGYDRALGVAAWQVQSVNGIPTKTGVPHITAMMENKSVKPFLAAKIKNWRKLAEPSQFTAPSQKFFPRTCMLMNLSIFRS
jgi:hypothetical protein